MKLSVCMIVKNEEEVLERLLKSVTQFADEIIIVDTGSSDNTQNIAKKYTNKVYTYKWIDDFSCARNYAFSFATCSYQMWLDADDIITQENIEKINKLKHNNSNADIYMLKYITAFDENNNPLFSYYRERIFKTSKHYVWQGFIHEAIVPSGIISYEDIEIHHKKSENSNPKRNYLIYNKHLKNGIIFNERETYYYAKECYYLGYYKKCKKYLKKFLKMPNKFEPNEIDAKVHIARCYALENNYDSAINILLSTISNHYPTSELICELANYYLKVNKIDTAIYFYQSALNLKPKLQSGAFIDNKYYYYIPLINLTCLCYNKDYELSKQYHYMLKNCYPKDKSVLLNDRFFK